MKNFISIFKRELKRFAGNKIMVTLFVGGPILYGLIFGEVYKKGKFTDIPIFVIDNDHSPLSATLIRMLGEADVIGVKYVVQDNVDLKKAFIKEQIYAAVLIPKNFEADILQNRHPELNTYINNSDLMPAGYVSRSIALTTGTLNAMLSASRNKPTHVFSVNTFRLYNPGSNYFLFVWPSYLAVIFQAVVLIVLAMSFASEIELNTFSELLVSTKSTLQIMLAKVMPYWILACITLTIYSTYFYLFRQPFPQHFFQTLVIIFLFIASVSFLGMIAGLMFKTQLRSLQFLIILSTSAYISSGYSWPFEYYGTVAKIFGSLFPLMPFINGFRILLIERGTLYDIKDFLGIQLLQLTIYFLIGYCILHQKIKKYRVSHAAPGF